MLCENSGAIYEGDFERGKRHGVAHYKTPAGDSYVGSFYEDKMGGEGQLTYANGNIYHGWFDGGHRSGQGELMGKEWSYNGQWWDDFPHGKGKVVKENGFAVVAVWVQGVVQESEDLEVTTEKGLKLTGRCA